MKKLFPFFFLCLFICTCCHAGPEDAVAHWQFSTQKINDSTFNMVASLKLSGDYHVYSFNPGGDGTLIPPSFKFGRNKNIRMVGKVRPIGKLVTEDTKDVMGKIYYYKHSVSYVQKIVARANTKLSGSVNFMVCNDNGCLPPASKSFSFDISGVKTAAGKVAATDTASAAVASAGLQEDTAATATAAPAGDTVTTALSTAPQAPAAVGNDEGAQLAKEPVWRIFLAGVANGFLAFIMPCIFSMLPVTVSFFTKRSKDRKTGIFNAVVYSLSIIFIFVAIGALLSGLISEKTMNQVSNSVGFNLFVFAVFVIFGLSLLGAFEITLPASWSSKLDSKASTSNVIGIFFMALVLVVVSFSCTCAFIGNLISSIIHSGNRMGGIFGFLGFGMAIALPFSLFAFFPGLLNQIAKPGGWLNAVKVVMGFVELALAMKYFSTVDLQYHWHVLDFEVYLSIWIALSLLIGLYLLGVFRFSHDDALPKNMFGQPHLSVTRIMFAIAAFSLTFYMIPGLWGAPLKGISGWLPERKTLDFNLSDHAGTGSSAGSMTDPSGPHPVKYTDNLKSELPGVQAFFDYEEGLAAAKATGRPVLLDFTGHSCVNCRKMERTVLSVEPVRNILKNDFIVISLYVDDRSELPAQEVHAAANGQQIATLGDKNLDIESRIYHDVAQPLYVLLDRNGKMIQNAGGYVPDIQRFVGILNHAKEVNAQVK